MHCWQGKKELVQTEFSNLDATFQITDFQEKMLNLQNRLSVTSFRTKKEKRRKRKEKEKKKGIYADFISFSSIVLHFLSYILC